MKESEKMIVVTDPRPWKRASDQGVPPRRREKTPEEEGDRKNPADHAGPPPADLRLPADELDERLQREGDQGRGENGDEHGCGEVEEGDHPEGRQECETRDGRSGKRCALHSNTLPLFTSRAIRILWYECRKRRAGGVSAALWSPPSAGPGPPSGSTTCSPCVPGSSGSRRRGRPSGSPCSGRWRERTSSPPRGRSPAARSTPPGRRSPSRRTSGKS